MLADRIPTTRQQDGITIVELGPEYDALEDHLLEDLQNFLMELATDLDPPMMVLDLSHTKYFGSSFLQVLFRVWNRLCSYEGGTFALSGLTPYCAEVLEVTHLDHLWEKYPNVETAIEKMRAA